MPNHDHRSPAALERLTAAQAHVFGVLPRQLVGELLVLESAESLEEEIRSALEEITRCALRVEKMPWEELRHGILGAYPSPDAGEIPLSPVSPVEARLAAPVLRICRRMIILATDPEVASLFLFPEAIGGTLRTIYHNGHRDEEPVLTRFLATCVVKQLKHFVNLDPTLQASQYGTLDVGGLKRAFQLVVETFTHDNQECVRVEIID